MSSSTSSSSTSSSSASGTSLADLLDEYRHAQSFSLALIGDLDESQVAWRPDENASAIAWHLGHQGAVNHYLVRNLTAAEVTFNAGFDAVFDSATPEPDRGTLPALEAIIDYRRAIATSTESVIERISAGDVGAPVQLASIADGLLRAVINHEYQHAKWVGEVRDELLGAAGPPAPEPSSTRLKNVEGYWMLASS